MDLCYAHDLAGPNDGKVSLLPLEKETRWILRKEIGAELEWDEKHERKLQLHRASLCLTLIPKIAKTGTDSTEWLCDKARSLSQGLLATG